MKIMLPPPPPPQTVMKKIMWRRWMNRVHSDPSDRRAPRCNLSKDLIEPATADEKLTWVVDLIK
jgi:hypothetical protein